MKCKCPACGALNSLDSLVANEQASEALRLALSFNGELGRTLISYLGLFRPEKSSLPFDRVAKILTELLPCIEQGEIKRDGKCYPAPVGAWIYAINYMLANRHQLKLPMKNHGYLFEVISRYKDETTAVISASNGKVALPQKQSKTTNTLQGIASWVNGGSQCNG